jgi:hypothetical protein
MHANEVEPYIIHRLSRAGWNGNPSFTPDSFATLFDETGGMPRKLNTLMNRVMLMGAVEQTTRIDAPLVEAVVADMAGKPFAYEEPLWATREPEMEIVAEIEAVLASVAEVEPALDEIKAFTAEANAVEEVGRIETPAFDAEVLISRIAALEQRVSEQDDALRRVLSTMIDWMDKEGNVEARLGHKNEAA